MWQIDRDYISVGENQSEDETTRVGTSGESLNVGHPIAPEIIDLPTTTEKTRFRMKDDDGNVYYGGWLHNDELGLNQQAALAFGMGDAGCTTIEIKLNNEWRQEID